MTRRHFVATVLAVSVVSAVSATSAHAQGIIKIGEVNSYKAQAAFLEPYKKGMELALAEVNASGGVLGRPLGDCRPKGLANWG